MNNVIIKFFRGNVLSRTEIFSNEMEADLYIANESPAYDYYVVEVGNTDAI
jgi:hypothetical protein